MTYDIDNNGDKEIFVNLSDLEGNKGALLGFFQNGEEVFDIDSNSNTVSGFYKYNNAGSRSIPAIANIDMDGKPEIINVTKGDPIIDDKRTLFVHHTFDHDNNYVPDTLWSAESGNFQTMGAVVSDLDGDFVPEIITKANYGAPIYVYSHEGSNYPGWPKNIGSAGGNVIPVATDLDRDGNKELVFGFSNGDGFDGGIYVFKNNGDPFFSEAANGLFYKSGMSGSVYDRMDSPVTAADVNGDGYPELICVSGNKDSLNNLKANIFILDKLGNTITGWDYNNPNHRLSIQSQELAELPATSVADIDHDFHFEIFLAANNKIYAWKPDGTPLNNHFPINVPGLLCKLIAPLIADVDGDDESEIIVLSNANENNSAIHAYNLDGSMVLGWPLRIPGENFFATPCIDDIDQDGKNEIIATAGSKIYVWDCEGSADEILWGKYRLNSYNNADLSDPCEYSTTPFYVSSEMTWTNDVQMNSDLIIQPGAKLTIKGNLYMPSEGKIIVKQSPSPAKMAGGTLVIDGGTITTLCRDSLWKGIEVWGLPGYSQTAHIANGKLIQGQVSIIHNGSIHNAKTGILASKEGIHGYAGGIVSADSATFENNRVAIRYDPYSYYNFSRLKRCNFITSDTLRDGSTPDYFVKLNGVNPVVFEGCTFKNTLPPPTIVITNTGRGSGIFSENAGFNVVAACLDSTSPCSHSRNSSFEKLYRGIYSMNSASAGSIHIADVNFYDNYAGLYLSGFNGVSYVEVLSNTFRNSSRDQWSYGMYLNECSGYHVENNEFYETSTNPVTIGLIVNNSGTLSNEIYRNSFHNLKYATLSQNVNRKYDPPLYLGGLCYRCNKFVKDDLTEPNVFDFSITYDGQYGDTIGIAKNQGTYLSGTSFAPVGNMFQPSPLSGHYDFYNEGNPVDYYYHSQTLLRFRLKPDPNNISGSVTSISVNEYFTESSCPSTLGGGGSGNDISKLVESGNKSDSIGGALSTLVDGGSTSLLTLDVATSTPPEALQTRNELIAKSPYLSDTVMKTSVAKEDVLDNAMIRDVLVANPHSAKSDEIINMLENRVNPMPDYMLEQILAGEDTVSAKEILEAKKAWWDGEAAKAYTRLLNYFKGDSIRPANDDSLNWLFAYRNTLSSRYDKVAWLHAKGDYARAGDALVSIPASFNLSPSEQAIQEAYLDFYPLSAKIRSDTLGVFRIDSATVSSLQSIANLNCGLPGVYARNLLIAAGKITFQEPV
ncbi:MAG TPA: FG-GAP-like repeat-containing protein, partial [Bacteroidales bacterium]|nr:FG-GAP-like repeat-containing protein [Bacteroidales bacterium]